VPINIPPLRERHEDILALAAMFVKEYNKKYSADFKLDPETLKSFQEYNWPGNVRELRNVIERNIIINLHNYDEENLSVMPHLPSNEHGDINIFKALGLEGPLKDVMKKVEEQYVRLALKDTGGKVGKAAEKLGIYRTVLYRKLKEYDEKCDDS
jgi:transcriptional regulator with PAS, ATPase and Fis domain